MQYRRLGRSGLLVSPLCLGTMNFGGPTSAVEAQTIIASAGQAGVNFIDTADVYTQGRSEEIVGAALQGAREQWIVATKVGNAMGEGPNRGGLSRRWIMQAIDASLRRLAMPYVDIYYLHREDSETPLEETVRAVGDLVRAGKIRYFGLSNFRAWRVAEICNLCDRFGLDRPIVSQPYYNAMNRMPEVEHLPACGHFGLGVVPYSPLARGILTGKYQAGRPAPSESRLARQDPRLLQTEWREESLEYARIIHDHAQARGQTAGQFAINWLLNNRLVTALVAGPRTIEQWRGYVAALDHGFTGEDEALVNRLVAAGHPSTPGYNDPAYPLEGRPTRTETSA